MQKNVEKAIVFVKRIVPCIRTYELLLLLLFTKKLCSLRLIHFLAGNDETEKHKYEMLYGHNAKMLKCKTFLRKK